MTIYNSDQVTMNVPSVSPTGDGDMNKRLRFTVTLGATALTTSDTINLGIAPKGFRISGAFIKTSAALDTNGTATLALNVGDATTAARIFSASTVGRTSGGGADFTPTAGCRDFQYQADTMITITPSAAAATGGAGQIVLHLTGTFDSIPG